MILDEFCEKNPQIKRPPVIKCELVDKAENLDLEELHNKIHASRFLINTHSLVWILKNAETILSGYYDDYEQYERKTPNKDNLNYGNAFKHWREVAGYSQLELSKKTGIPQDIIAVTENGEKNASIHYCVLLADFYGISLDELVGRNFSNEKKN